MTSSRSTRYVLSLAIVGLSACAPALPLMQEKPEEFVHYVAQAEDTLKRSDAKLKEAEMVLEESQKLVDEAQSLYRKMITIKGQKEAAARSIKAERAAWERRKRQAEREAERMKEELEQKAAEVAPSPARAPYSASDAPL